MLGDTLEQPVNIGRREAALEEFMRDLGVQRYEERVAKARDRGTLSDTAGGTAIVRHLVEPMEMGIRKFLADEAARLGRPSLVSKLVAELPAELVAYLVVKEAVNVAAGGAPILRVARHLGSVLEDEVRMAAFDEAAPALYRTVDRDMRRKSWDAAHVEWAFSAMAKVAEIELPRWSSTEKVHVGLKLLDLLMEHTGLVCDVNKPVKRNKLVKYIYLSDIGRRWVDERNGKEALLRPVLTPTIVQPLSWTATTGGGYLTHAIRPFCVVKRTYRSHVEALKAANLGPVYRAMNAVQDTPWRINGRVLAVLEEAMERGTPFPGVPLPDPEPLPPKPHDIDTNDAAKRGWKEEAKKVYERNAEMEGRRLELAHLLTIGREYRDEPRIFFPHQLDFRGRFYAVPNTLQPQGSDRAKALLHFAEGKPVGKAGLRWLAIHGANVFGFDKASFDERERWAWKHGPEIIRCAEDPFSNRWWTEADSPWCFLAWCFEWGKMLMQGAREDHISHLPIALDGSCNGLQHFSAMLRDPVGGAAVNLVPAHIPQDIYQRVADRALERLTEEVANARAERREAEEKPRWAYGWLAFGLNRKITKRAVMVLPYGGTMRSCLDYTREAVRERIKDGTVHNFGDELPKAEAYLAGVIWAAIGDVVVAAKEVMSWLQKVARVAAKYGQPLQWVAPSGFVAHQEYRELRHLRIKSRLRGAIIKVSHFDDGPELDVHRQASGASPNFVHSMDAAAMVLTINRCLDDGIASFAMIHDSYGTHAADTGRLAMHLRGAFVSMYEEHDVLAEFRDAVAASLPEEARALLPPLPPKGRLDLQQVHQSVYFFA